jgi:hypothetical protein
LRRERSERRKKVVVDDLFDVVPALIEEFES